MHYLIGLLCVLLLQSCSTIEQRSDEIPRTPLAAIETRVQGQLLWSKAVSAGSDSDTPSRLDYNQGNLIIADKNGSVQAVNLQGQMQWQQDLKSPVTAGPSSKGRYTLVGLGNATLVSLDSRTGERLWRANLNSEIVSPPLVTQDTVYVHTLDGTISALRAVDGFELWQVSLNAPILQLRRGAQPQLYNDKLIAAMANGRLAAIQSFNGALEWQQEVSVAKGHSDLQRMVDISGAPVIHNGAVYVVAYHGPLCALDAQTGAKLWQTELSSFTGLTRAASTLLVSELSGDVSAVDIKYGRTLWQQKALHGRRLTRPVQLGAHCVVADDEGYLHFLDAAKGHIVGRILVDKQGIDATPLVKDSQLYVLSTKGRVYAYQIQG